ncbi:MAG: DNA repair protein RecN [Elusimicrobiota bacterium]
MLQTLLIKNYAIIDDITIDFGEAVNILTGETGAGKSIIVDALGLVLGERAGSPLSSVIRRNAQSCEIIASFNIENLASIKKLLSDTGITAEELLVIKREITTDGKTKCYINGTPSTVGMLQTTGNYLVDIHGQHEHQSLLKIENQRDILDSYGNLEVQKSGVCEQFEKFNSIKKQLADLTDSEKERLQKLDLYKYQLKEIEDAKLIGIDETELENEYNRLNNAEKLFNYAQEIYSLLYETDGSVIEKTGIAKKQIENISVIDTTIQENINLANKIIEDIKILADTFRRYKDSISFNPKRLEGIIVQIELIKKLKRKYAPTVKEILEYAENIRQQINFFEKADENIAKLEKELKSTETKLRKLSIDLSEKRLTVSKKLAKEIEQELSELGMGKSKFVISVEQQKDFYSSTGIDRVEYKIATNVGEDIKPLKLVASGGEMSRIMLAIKTVLAKADDIPTLVFDEIDAGLSGPMGQVVGSKLKSLSENHQVLCITHLPQLAAFSSTHFHISKIASFGKTITTVSKLSAYDKIAEISRMLGGGSDKKVSETSIKHAKELIKQAEQS